MEKGIREEMQEHLPVLRVYLLGPFRLEKVEPDGESRVIEDFEERLGRAWSVVLFKLLLCSPSRQVKGDALVRAIWPGQTLVSIRHSLDTTKWKLARTLEDLCGRPLFPRTSGTSPVYATAPQSEIWTDLQACEQAHAQALATRDPASALVHWQAAYAFTQRGELLADDRATYWYTSSLIQGLRTKLTSLRRQCVLRLADLSLECGEISRALAILTAECEADPTHEELVFHLMNVLAHLGYYPEALACYTQLEAALLERGTEPREETKRLALWLRAQGMTKCLSGYFSIYRILPLFSQEGTQDIIEASLGKLEDQNGTSSLLMTDRSLIQQPAWMHQEGLSLPLSPEHMELLLALGRGDYTMLFDQSKRDALQKIAAAFLAAARPSTIVPFATSDPEPWERLSQAQLTSSPSTLLSAATLAYFEQLLTISWLLCDQNQFVPAEGVLMSFLPQLLSLPKQESRTAFLASHGLGLQGIFAGHHLRLGDKVRLCEQSVNYARLTGNANTLVTALIELAISYEYTKQPDSLKKRLMTLQEALNESQEASPLVQSRTYWQYSAALASSGRIREAEVYIGLAQEVFPDDPTQDPGFAFAEGNIFSFSYRAGLVHIDAGRAQQAFSAFEYYKQHPSGLAIPDRFRFLIVNGQSRAAILDNDAERYAGLLEDVLIGSARMGSQKRFDEALHIFQEDMPASWLQVQRIKQLVEQYGLKREK